MSAEIQNNKRVSEFRDPPSLNSDTGMWIQRRLWITSSAEPDMVNTNSTTCSNKKNHNCKTSRSYRSFNEQIFLQDLAQTNWNPVLNTGDVDLPAELFEKMFLDIIDKHVPFKKRTHKKTSPWMTNEFLNMMREQDKLKVTATKSGNDHSCWENYRKARNNTNKFIKVKKKEFLNQGFTKHNNNIKKTQEHLRHAVPSRNKDTKIPLINTDNGPVTKPKDKANELNKFFSEIGLNLANRIDENDFCDYKKINNNKAPTFNLVHVDYDNVFNQLTKLSNDKATSLDNIPYKLLKLAAPVITPIITHLINHSFTTCKFPSCWKRARVIPVFKAGWGS